MIDAALDVMKEIMKGRQEIMGVPIYHVMVVTDADHRTRSYREKLESASETEVEACLTELVPRHSASSVKVFTEVKFTYQGMAQLRSKGR